MTRENDLLNRPENCGDPSLDYARSGPKPRFLRKTLIALSTACALMLGLSSYGNFGTKSQAAEPSLKIKSLSYHTFEEQDLKKEDVCIEDVIDDMQTNAVRFISEHWKKVSEEDAREIVEQAFISGKVHDIDPLLILAIIATESSFNPQAGSAAGAKGLMQVHAKVHAKRFQKYGGLKAVHDVEAGIEVGTQILKEYLNKTGTLKGALKYYVGAAKHSSDGGYSRKVLSMRSNLQLAVNGEVEAARIQAKAPSRIPEDHQDHKDFASYSENMKVDKFPALIDRNESNLSPLMRASVNNG